MLNISFQKNVNYYFPIAVWLISIFLAPVLPVLLAINLSHKNDLTMLSFIYLSSLTMGGLFSIPTLLVGFIVFLILANSISNLYHLKIVSIAVACTLVVLSFFLLHIFYRVLDYSWGLTFSYVITIIFSGMSIRIDKKVEDYK